jgi:hypothetical protein
LSPAPEREDLGALGCTRDGYQLIGVGMLVVIVPLVSIEFFAFAANHRLLDVLFAIMGWTNFLGGGLVVLGIAATSVQPNGPFPRWAKVPTALGYAAAVVSGPLANARLFENHVSVYLRTFGEWLTWLGFHGSWPWLAATLSLCLFSGVFSVRRKVLAAAIGWAVLGGWYCSLWYTPQRIDGWRITIGLVAVGITWAAPLYLARRLRLSIHAAAARPS